MPFVNEIMSENDISKYGLDKLKEKYNPWAWKDGRPAGFTHAWTIDRDRAIFFVPIFSISEIGRSGRPEYTTKTVCYLYYKGRYIKFTIDKDSRSSSVLTDSPFRIIWDLVELDLSQISDVPDEIVTQTIKEALTVYGCMGAHLQAPNTVVQFNF